MLRKPVIGINADLRPPQNNSPAYSFIADGYYRRVLAAGGIPIIVPPLEHKDQIDRVLDMLDGFIMIGGSDLDPRRDGFMLHPSVRTMDSRRETFDRLLVDRIAYRRMPVFGIGAGMQLLNVAAGGNLFLHLAEDIPEALPHKDAQDPAHRHSLQVVPDSVMERVYGDGEIRVNSMHHMAVDEVAPGFRVTARCPDGVIEAIESVMSEDGFSSDWFAMGTQFHPEAESASALDIRIFEEFIQGVMTHRRASHEMRALVA